MGASTSSAMNAFITGPLNAQTAVQTAKINSIRSFIRMFAKKIRY